MILENVFIDIPDYVSEYPLASAGGIAEHMFQGIIKNCKVTGTILAQQNSGGIVASNSWGSIVGCSFEGIVKTI